LFELKVENGKLKITVSAPPTIPIIAEGNTITFNFPLSIFHSSTYIFKQKEV